MITTNFNPSVLTTQRNLNNATNSLNTALERMSTGYKVNCAADDAAGMFVASNLNANIRGLKQAQKNAQDGISLLNTAEGSLSNMTNILNRLRDLAVQGANGVYEESSREAIQKETEALKAQLEQLHKSTAFNGKNVFTGESVQPDNTANASAAAISTLSGGGVNSTLSANISTASVSALSDDTIPAGYTPIYTVEDLDNIRNNLDADGNIVGNYILMNDLDLSGINWEPIGQVYTRDDGQYAGYFQAVFDGNGHTIKNLYINRPDEKYIGLFGSLSSGAKITNLGLTDVDVTGDSYVGGLTSSTTAGTEIYNCFVTGEIKGSDMFVGGICGVSGISGKISNCYADVDVIGYSNVGGLAGAIIWNSILSNCYVSGSVSGNGNVGAIVGLSQTGIVENCFWLEDTPGSTDGIGNDQGTSNNNSGLTSDEMQNSDNFTDAGWDENIWDFSTGKPTLKPVPQPPSTDISENIIRLQIGANSTDSSAIFIDTGFSLGAMDFDYMSEDGCAAAIDEIDSILERINTKRAEIGATINRINSILDSQTTTTQNYTAAKSTIMDADIANESADFVKNQILQQTSSALLAQSQNLHASIVLSLIG